MFELMRKKKKTKKIVSGLGICDECGCIHAMFKTEQADPIENGLFELKSHIKIEIQSCSLVSCIGHIIEISDELPF